MADKKNFLLFTNFLNNRNLCISRIWVHAFIIIHLVKNISQKHKLNVGG